MNNLDYFEAFVWPFCQKNCIFCSEWWFWKRKFVSLIDFQKILDNNNFWKVVLTWWEPLLNRKLLDYVTFCKQKNIKVWLVTAFDKNISQDFLKKIIDSWLDEIMISLEWIEKIHDFLVQENWAYKNIIENLYFLWKLKNINTKIIIHTNVNKVNYKILPFFVSKILQNFPFIFTYHIQMLEPFGNAYKNKNILFDNYSDLLEIFFKNFDNIFNNYKIKFWRLPFCIVPEKYHNIVSTTPKIYEKKDQNIVEWWYFGTKYLNIKCKNCKKFDICDWFFNYYIDMYWNSEITPFL